MLSRSHTPRPPPSLPTRCLDCSSSLLCRGLRVCVCLVWESDCVGWSVLSTRTTRASPRGMCSSTSVRRSQVPSLSLVSASICLPLCFTRTRTHALTHAGAPVHFHRHAWNVLLFGEKRWFLFPAKHAFYSRKHAHKWYREDYPNLTVCSLLCLSVSVCMSHCVCGCAGC